ncbi:MAG: hypothetical protein AB7I19_16735 [Planctomycetota bacterium]
MIRLRSLWLSFAVLTTTGFAQQNVGISFVNVLSPSLAGFCGFDCNDAGNTGRTSIAVGSSLGIRLHGQISMPGVVLLGLGPAHLTCPGLTFAGIHNGMMIFPADLIVALSTPILGSPIPGCRASGGALAVMVTVPAAAAGTVLTAQGLAFDRNTMTFTRPVDIAIR